MQSPSSVAVNAAVLGERPTGLGVFAAHVVRELATLGERLIVHTSCPESVAGPGVVIRPISEALRPERGARGHLARLLWVQTGLRAAVARDRPRLVLNLMAEGLFRPPVPQVVTVHDLFPLRFPDEYPRLRYYFRYVVPVVLKHSRAVITISEASRSDILRFYGLSPAKVHVALCGYDAARFTPGGGATDIGEPYALAVGNVMPHKNLLRLVDAFAAATRGIPARLVIRGRGRPAHVRALHERIALRGLEGRVDWAPYAAAAELPGLYRGARMLVLPSLYEGFGLTALEAMACGTPVVASGTSSLPEVVGDAAILVDPLDPGAIADAMVRLFTDDHLAKDCRERGLARAGRFSWAHTGRAVQAVMRSALGEAA